ncbi:MAG: septum formation initiator family protein [Hespellia sp.]|nr:septum formation initiator family protein [Hespellia sp.]
MTKNRRKRSRAAIQKKTQLRRHKRSIFLVSAVVVLLTITIFSKSVSLQAQNREYEKQAAELQSQIDDEKQRSEEIGKLKEYITSDEYVKEIAEDRLGLVNPNEIIFRPAE